MVKDYIHSNWQYTMHPMSNSAFRQIVDQLKYMSPAQLKCLEMQIHESLEINHSTLLTDDELRMLASLFESCSASCQ